MCSAALQYARRGWPVFPCREHDGQPYTVPNPKGGDPIEKQSRAKQPYGGSGLKDATTDEQRIVAWWRDNPNAMIGLPQGVNGCFVLDFDPRPVDVFDPETGEIERDGDGQPLTRMLTLEELKADLEAMMGVPLPRTVTGMTPSGGVHVYFRQPTDGGAAIKNSGSLPEHVDVRGAGGYTIAEPSRIVPPADLATYGEYRWLRDRGDWRNDADFAQAPPELIAILRGSKAKVPVARPAEASADVEYRSAVQLVCEHQKASTSWLQRQLRIGYNSAARLIERMEKDGIVSRPDHVGRREVLRSAPLPETARPSDRGDVSDAVRKYALSGLDAECRAIRKAGSGRRNAQLNESAFKVATLVAAGALDAGVARASVEAAARDNPGRDDEGQLLASIESGWTAGLNSPRDLSEVAAASRSRAVRPAGGATHPSGPPRTGADRPPPAARARDSDAKTEASFRDGRVDGVQGLPAADAARLRDVAEAWAVGRLKHCERTRDAVHRLAFSFGRRIAAGLLDETDMRERLWAEFEALADVQHADIDRAIDDGAARGFDLAAQLVTLRCVGHPMTDFGIAERFRDRFGLNFRFTTGKGWLGWDERRWKVLDQDEKTLPAEVISAVFETVRAIQEEARFMEATGIRVDPGDDELDLEQRHPHGLDRLIPKGKNVVTLSSMMRAWGRQSETTGKPAAVALLARRWLTVPIERFDHDPYALNVLNGTLRFRREEAPDGTVTAGVTLEPHDREDMLTKLSPVEYDAKAKAPRYDAMFAWAQPDAAMRRYLHQVGGYSLTGDAGEQKLWFWYGRGRNGKGVTLDSWSHVAGDYADNIPIGSFLDQGIKKRGDQASPDLAKLGGVRMLRSSEPGRNEKLDSGLIKLVTGGDPLPVRMLHRGFFNLQPQFKLIIMGNTRFDIPDTDDGIWSRLKLIPWLRNIEKPEAGVPNWPEKDPKLGDKIRAEESAGVLNRLVAGLLDYMVAGLIEPKSVTEATSAYRDASDPLARFLRLCVETVEDDKVRVQSSTLHEVFVAWCKAAGEREWSNKGFANAMVEKGYRKKASDGMQWLGLRLIRGVSDFVDEHGKAITLPDEFDAPLPNGARPPPDDDDFVPPMD